MKIFGISAFYHDSAAAIEHLCLNCLRPGGSITIGLYHKYGRQPFLDHFEQMKQQGATKEQLLNRYRELHSQHLDETHLVSRFRDRVLHPHETQHTLAEMLPILEQTGMKLIATSINHFQPIESLERLIEEETKYQEIAKKKLQKNQYFPGFFLFTALKT